MHRAMVPDNLPEGGNPQKKRGRREPSLREGLLSLGACPHGEVLLIYQERD